MVKIKVYYGSDELYVADLYQLCVCDGFLFTLSDTPLLAHSFPSLNNAICFADEYLTGRKVSYIQGGHEYEGWES